MDNSINMNKPIGLFIKRKNSLLPTSDNLHKELLLYLLEIQIMLEATDTLINKKLKKLDCLVGDWKCQSRASMIQDLFNTKKDLFNILETSKKDLTTLQTKIQNLVNNFDIKNNKFNGKIIKKFKYESMLNFIEEYKIEFTPYKELTFISLCFLIYSPKEKIHELTLNQVSNKQIKKIIEIAKKTLCQLSIDYEQNLAKTYGSNEEQKILTQVETNAFCSMTSAIPGFKHILQKIKVQNQQCLMRTFIFCGCGGIQNIKIQLFKPKNCKFEEIMNFARSDEPSMILDGYQFPGSFEQLKKNLNVPTEESLIPQKFYKKCTCNNPTAQYPIQDMEKAMLASLAQHPQFTNGASIKFKELELEGSEIEKEYLQLKSQPGYCRNNMSKFFAYHVYASTIADVLKEEDEISQKLEK